MANEAICYELPTRFARYRVSDGTGIAKGTLLKLTTPNTAAAATADNDVFGGVAWMEKVANDGTVEISAALNGTWGLTASTGGGITIGNDVVIDSSNMIKVYTTLDDEKGYVIGKALETIGTSGAVIKVRMNV